LAADLRVEIREQFEAGASEAEIKQFLLDRYGDFILYRPQLTGSTSVLWAAPVLLMIVGLAVAIGVVRRRRNLPADLDLDGEPDQEEWN
jgi:cytochrome c-type biogenesis protein CcmH